MNPPRRGDNEDAASEATYVEKIAAFSRKVHEAQALKAQGSKVDRGTITDTKSKSLVPTAAFRPRSFESIDSQQKTEEEEDKNDGKNDQSTFSATSV